VNGHDPTTEYARQVVSGGRVAGKLVRLACARHLRDLETCAARGLTFDAESARKAIGFFDNLKHSKGEHAGAAFRLEPWQAFIVGSLFGWMRANGTRRFRTAYMEIGRKNGKSTLLSGIGLLTTFFDHEPGAEGYCAATKKDQARIVFDEMRRMVQRTSGLRARIKVGASNLHREDTASKLEPLGADADTLDGLNVHFAAIDEVHAHKTRAVVDVIETATGARRQPLIVYITTAGYDRTSVCWELRSYSVQVLEHVFDDDTWFGFIATIDEGDAWHDETAWAKANPNLHVSVHLDDLQRKAAKAKRLPTAQNAFRRLHLNEWTEQSERWLPLDEWDACNAPSQLEDGRLGFIGLDLSSTRDIAAALGLFPHPDDGVLDVLPRFWIPDASIEAGARERSERDKERLREWIQQGLITATPGNVIDYDVIRRDLNALAEQYMVREIAYDPWNATQLVTQLQGDGFECFPLRQGFASLSAPSKELEARVLSRRIRHGAHPVLRWMASNVAVEMDAAGNIKPSKKASTEKIDGIVALVIALDRVTRSEGPSVYESRGLQAL
jgi:phage terminase large subunit-like protein